MARVYIGLGSNLGDKQRYIHTALERLSRTPSIRFLRVASLYESEPWGNTQQNWYLNTVAELDTDLPPLELLEVLLTIEKQLGRIRQERWGPRTIDLDLLLYGQEEVNHPDLQVPHPRMTERAFVLVPLAELCPERFLGQQKAKDWAAQAGLDQKIKKQQSSFPLKQS